MSNCSCRCQCCLAALSSISDTNHSLQNYRTLRCFSTHLSVKGWLYIVHWPLLGKQSSAWAEDKAQFYWEWLKKYLSVLCIRARIKDKWKRNLIIGWFQGSGLMSCTMLLGFRGSYSWLYRSLLSMWMWACECVIFSHKDLACKDSCIQNNPACPVWYVKGGH